MDGWMNGLSSVGFAGLERRTENGEMDLYLDLDWDLIGI